MRRRTALGAATLSLLALAAVRGGGGGPPLYDGICTAPAYLKLGGNPPPPSRSKTYSATDIAQTLELADNDSTPQAQVIIGSGSLAPAPGSSTVTLSITPVKPPGVGPAGGTVDGNVYDFEAVSGGHPVALAAGHPATVVLSATSTGGPQITLQHFDGTHWTPAAKTFQSGCGTTYEAAEPTLGLFALVATGSSVPGSAGNQGGGAGLTIVVVVAAVLVTLGLVIGAVRVRRQRDQRRPRR